MDKPKPRFTSVDFYRGLTVGFMIVANNPGDTACVYRNLIHSRWHGWTLVDFIFPIFLFLVGVSIALACPGDAIRRPGLWPKALKRAALLFLLGLFVNWFPRFDLGSLRIPGVLQRISVVYLATLFLYQRLNRKWLAVAIAAILIGYWVLWTFVPVPGLGFPTLDVEYNLESWLDQMLMRGHLWEYDTGWDPEGILSTVPCVALALLGVLSGGWLNGESKASPALAFIVGLILHLVGVAWGTHFPINKIITTSSFVLFVGGVGIMLLVACHVLIDRLRLDRFAYPVVSLGKNALFIYVFSELLTDILYFTRLAGEAGGKLSLHKWLFGKVSLVVEGCYAASLVWAIGYMAILTALAVLMNRKKLIVRL